MEREGRGISERPRKGLRTRIFDAGDARALAQRRLPRLVFDFIEGAAGRETAVQRNCRRFDDILMQPKVMLDVGERSLKTELFGHSYDLPFGVAPMGMCALSCPRADRFLGVTARQRNIPVCLSSAGSSTIEEMFGWGDRNTWFQLYVSQSIEQSMALVERARVTGYDTLILTVDVPQVSRRTRDLRNGFVMPFVMGPRQFVDLALHPRWSLETLARGIPRPKNFDAPNGVTFDRHASRAGANWSFLDHLRQVWKGTLIVKGITSPSDAMRVRAAGADAVYVSNHGGRQLDSVPASVDLLPPIRAAVGPSFPLLFDSGVRSGEDVLKALALGADFVMMGRPFLHALGAEGREGLEAMIDAVIEDLSTGMAQLGLTKISEINEQCLWRGNRPNQAIAEENTPHLKARSA